MDSKELSMVNGGSTPDLESLKHGGFHATQRVGRYVLDPEEAIIEYGKEAASKLQTTPDGKTILWPQPRDDPLDPQGWSKRRKSLNLLVACLSAFLTDFTVNIGLAAIGPIAVNFGLTPDQLNNKSINWSVLCVGLGAPFFVLASRKWGRLPVLFLSQILMFGFLIGCTAAMSLPVFTAMRCIQAFFAVGPQVIGLLTICDMYPVHEQGPMVTLWTLAYGASASAAPWLLGYLSTRQDYRWAFAVGLFYTAIVLVAIATLADETLYERDDEQALEQLHDPATSSRLKILFGFQAIKMAKYRTPLWRSTFDMLNMFWKPHFFFPSLLLTTVYGFTIGLFNTAPVVLESPQPVGYGVSADIAYTCFLAPLVATFIAQISSSYFVKGAYKVARKMNSGVLEAEMALLPTIPGIILFVVGFVLVGWTISNAANIAGIIFGWGFELAGLVYVIVGVFSYLTLTFPERAAEISGWINLLRVAFGFSVPFFQTKWLAADGALKVFGTQAGIASAVFLLSVIPTFLFGRRVRDALSAL